MKIFTRVLLMVMSMSLVGCGYNDLQRGDESIKASLAEIQNQYQRRADLVPNLIKTVQAYVDHERKLIIDVTEARTRVSQLRFNPEMMSDEDALQKYQSVQGELAGAISRLLVVAENYPQLKSDGAFRDLQAQLEGTENRIAVARGRYIKAVQRYNSVVRSFPSNLTAKLFDHTIKATFSVDNAKEISTPPEVDLISH
jgi:LemA protein